MGISNTAVEQNILNFRRSFCNRISAARETIRLGALHNVPLLRPCGISLASREIRLGYLQNHQDTSFLMFESGIVVHFRGLFWPSNLHGAILSPIHSRGLLWDISNNAQGHKWAIAPTHG